MATGKLAEVEQAAIRIQTKRFNEYFEEQQYQQQLRAEAAEKKEEQNKSGKGSK